MADRCEYVRGPGQRCRRKVGPHRKLCWQHERITHGESWGQPAVRLAPWEPRTRPTLAERFWEKVDRGDPETCWPFHKGHPYGQFKVPWRTSPEQAHRIAWYLAHGEHPPKDRFVCHVCDNPPCCNPAHLFLGTAQDNSDDCRAKGRAQRPGTDPNHDLLEAHAAYGRARRQNEVTPELRAGESNYQAFRRHRRAGICPSCGEPKKSPASTRCWSCFTNTAI